MHRADGNREMLARIFRESKYEFDSRWNLSDIVPEMKLAIRSNSIYVHVTQLKNNGSDLLGIVRLSDHWIDPKKHEKFKFKSSIKCEHYVHVKKMNEYDGVSTLTEYRFDKAVNECVNAYEDICGLDAALMGKGEHGDGKESRGRDRESEEHGWQAD